jgi:hypothetical protein
MGRQMAFFCLSPLSKEALMGVITLGLLWSGKLGGFGQISLWGISFFFCPLIASSPYYTLSVQLIEGWDIYKITRMFSFFL